MDRTIPELKKAFLTSQVRILSAPLEPTPDWRGTELPVSGDLDEKVVSAVLAKVNALLKNHNASAFPAPAISHVAAQIDALYWATSAPSLDPSASASILPFGSVPRTADLTTDEGIDSLPDAWPEEEDEGNDNNDDDDDDDDDDNNNNIYNDDDDDEIGDAQDARTSRVKNSGASKRRSSGKAPRRSAASRTSGLESFAEGARYRQLRARLEDLRAQRREARRRLEQTRAVTRAVEPLRDPGKNLQGSIVTRDGELARELERMVALGARLGARLEAVREAGGVGSGQVR